MQPTIDRDPRVRFKHPVRVVPIGGPPRAYRVLASNLSREGMFLRMPAPFDAGTKVALSLEAGGRVLPFAQAEVVWRDLEETKSPGRGAGFGVRFTGFLHPRAHELVDYLVANLETGKPLSAPEPVSPWRRRLVWVAAGLVAVVLGGGITAGALRISRAEPRAEALGATIVEPVAEAAVVAEPTPEAVADPEPTTGATPEVAATPMPEPTVGAAPEAAPRPIPTIAPVEAVAEPVPVPKVEAKAPAPARPAAPTVDPKPEAQLLSIPSGAVRSITATVDGNQLALKLTLASGAGITRAFTLRNPDRLAIDIRGAAPKKSHTLSGSAVIQKIRVGRLPRGTRIVLDLSRAPGQPVVVSGTSVSVPLR